MTYPFDIIAMLMDHTWARLLAWANVLENGLVAHRKEFARVLRRAEQHLRRYLILLALSAPVPNRRPARPLQKPPTPTPTKSTPTPRAPNFRLEEPERTAAQPKRPIPRIRDPFAPLPPPIIPRAAQRPDALFRRFEALRRVLMNPDRWARAMARKLIKLKGAFRLKRIRPRTRKKPDELATLDAQAHEIIADLAAYATGPPP